MKPDPLALIHRVRRSVWTLPLAAVTALVIFAINEAAYNRSTAALADLGERAVARTQIQVLWRSLVDAETGQRGYLLTGREEYLEPFERGRHEAEEALRWLRDHYGRDSEAEPVVDHIAQRAIEKLSELTTTVSLYRQGRQEAARELVLTDIGREKMDGVRDASQKLLAMETASIAAERQDVFATLRTGRIGVNLMTMLGLLGLALFLRQTLALDRAQRLHAKAMQAEHEQLEGEVARRTADLTELARHLQRVREDERGRLARELHDELGALLTAAKLDAARLKRVIGVLAPDVEARLKQLNETINRGIELKRRIIEDLRPSSLSNLGLVAALEILTREFGARSELQLATELEAVPLSDSAQTTAYRLVQEALTNIAKHADARQVNVTLLPQNRDGVPGVRVAVQDDGLGFDPAMRRGTTHGLMGMRYRVESEGGQMGLRSAPGQGTCIEAWLPASGAMPPAEDALGGGWAANGPAVTSVAG